MSLTIHLFHLQRALFQIVGLTLPILSRPLLLSAHPLITRVVGALETHICRRSWSSKYCDEVSEDVVLAERTMTIFGEEFMRVEIFPGRLSTSHEENVVATQTGRIRKYEDGVDEHGKCASQRPVVTNSGPERRVVLIHPDQYMCERCCQ